MASYVVVKPLDHDGNRYAPGDAVPAMDKGAARRLLDLGVILPMVTAKAGNEEAERPNARPTHAELDAEAARQGVQFPPRSTIDQKTAILAELEKEDPDEDGVPEGVDPQLL